MSQDTPHRLDVFRRPSPITLNCEVAELNRTLTARLNSAGGANDLFGDKALRPERGFMVEQDPVSSKQSVGIAIIDHRPMCRCFSDRVGTARMEWCLFSGSFNAGIAETFARAGIVDPNI